ncbi:hypothetical protein HK097_000327, partial [Rhizophlyctis rosea]
MVDTYPAMHQFLFPSPTPATDTPWTPTQFFRMDGTTDSFTVAGTSRSEPDERDWPSSKRVKLEPMSPVTWSGSGSSDSPTSEEDAIGEEVEVVTTVEDFLAANLHPTPPFPIPVTLPSHAAPPYFDSPTIGITATLGHNPYPTPPHLGSTFEPHQSPSTTPWTGIPRSFAPMDLAAFVRSTTVTGQYGLCHATPSYYHCVRKMMELFGQVVLELQDLGGNTLAHWAALVNDVNAL